MKSDAAYDAFADFYNKEWGTDYHRQLVPVLGRLLLREIGAGDDILDIGCGTGEVAARLIERGFRVTGIDQSERMLSFARINAPKGEFFCADASHFELPERHRAAIATFEALNHILEPESLLSCLTSVWRAIERVFVFDMLREEAYEMFWNGTSSVLRDGIECWMSSRYDPSTRIAECRVRMDARETVIGKTVIHERCYEDAEVRGMLSAAGFSRIHVFDAASALGMTGDISIGRVFYQCFR